MIPQYEVKRPSQAGASQRGFGGSFRFVGALKVGRRYVEERTTVTVVTILEAAPLVWALQHEEAGSDYGASYDTRECNGVNSESMEEYMGAKTVTSAAIVVTPKTTIRPSTLRD